MDFQFVAWVIALILEWLIRRLLFREDDPGIPTEIQVLTCLFAFLAIPSLPWSTTVHALIITSVDLPLWAIQALSIA